MTATTVSQAVEKRENGPIAVMWSKKSHLDAVLPDSIDVKAFLGTAAGALYASEKLMKAATASPDSLIVALMECAALGHMPGTDEYYLTPRSDHGRPRVLGIEGYKGVIERMYRSGAVARVVVREVCVGDPFRYVEGIDVAPVHEIGGNGGTGADFFAGAAKRGEMVGAYAYAQLTTGATSRVVILTRDDVFAARDSGGYKPDDQYTPWNRPDGGKEHPEFTGRSMWWKTAAKRLEPWVPTSREYRASMLSASAKAAELAAPRTAPELPPADSGIVDAEIVDDTPDASPAAVPTAADGSARPPSEPAPPPAAGEVPARASSGQRSKITREYKRLSYNPDDPDDAQAILRQTAKLALLDELGTLDELDEDQAERVLQYLGECGDSAQLNELLASGEAPEGSDG